MENTRFLRHEFAIGRAELVADVSGCLYWPAEHTVIVADLHLEKASAYARRGVMLPPYDTRETLARLDTALQQLAPDTVVALGDSFHDAGGAARLGREESASLRRMQRGRTWIWVHGNHDAGTASFPGGEAVAELSISGISLRHEPSTDEQGFEIAGHLHPAARIAFPGASLRRRCFVSDGRRAVLPAFGAFTGGLNVLSEAFAPLFPLADRLGVALLGARGIYPAPSTALRPD